MSHEIPLSNSALPEHMQSPVSTKESGKIKVVIHIPTGLAENLKQQKINRIYDILAQKNSR